MPIQVSGIQLGVITGGPSPIKLSDLNDVSIVSPLTGQYLRYNAGISEWQNAFINSDIYNFLNTNLTSSPGITLTKTPGPNTVNISLSLTASGDATGTAAAGNLPLTLATVNSSPQSDTFRRITVNGKGLTTATSVVGASDITTALGYTPVNVAGDTMTGFLILNADPVASLGAVTKQYADAISSGITVHEAVTTGTTATLASTSGGTITYNNGASGVGATLTTTGTYTTIGGFSAWIGGDRVLVKDEASQLTNGVYVRTSSTVLTRATDFDGTPTSEIQSGDLVFVVSGTLSGTSWVQTTLGIITVGTTSIVFTQFSSATALTAGTGIDITTNVVSNTGVLSLTTNTGLSTNVSATGNVTVTNTGVTSATGTANQITVSASSGAVTFSLPTAVTIGGTMTAGIFSGSGASLTSIPNGALTNSSVTVGTTAISLGASATTIIGLTSVTSTTFVGALSGNATTATSATTATNVTGGAAGSLVYQTAASTTTTLAAGTSSQVLVSGTTPSWTNTPILTGTNFTGIPNGALTNSSLTLGSTSMALGSTTTTVTGLVSTTSDRFVVNGSTVPTNGIYLSAANTFAIASNTTERITVNSTGNTVVNAPSSGIGLTVTGLTTANTALDVTAATAGAKLTSRLSNTSNTASSDARQLVLVAGSSAGDALTEYQVSAITSWSVGVDNSATDNFVIAASSTLGTSNALSITTAGAATFSSSVDAVSFNATSTKRVKKAIKNISRTYLDKFADLRPREYDRKDYKAHEFGFIAEEMALVYPEVVGKDSNGTPTGIDYGKLSTILTAKVQEQQKVINKLTEQMATVMGLLKGLK